MEGFVSFVRDTTHTLKVCLIFIIVEETPKCCQPIERFNKEQIRKQLLNSFVYDKINREDLSAGADNVKNCQEAVKIIEECENMIKTNKKNIIRFAYEQGKIF